MTRQLAAFLLPPQPNPRYWSGRRLLVIASGLFLASAAVIVWVVAIDPAPRVPLKYVQSVTSPVYLPTRLPAGYTITPDAYQVREGALLMSAHSQDGGLITISQQAKPSDVNFDDFYHQRLSQPHTLPRTPYLSVWGSAADQHDITIMSILADQTWLIVTARPSLSEPQLRQLADHLHRQ